MFFNKLLEKVSFKKMTRIILSHFKYVKNLIIKVIMEVGVEEIIMEVV